MSETRLIVRDARREIHGTLHGSFADAAVAALSAEPETIEELDTAIERFQRPGEWSFFRGFQPEADDEPYDAGIVIIDLAARLVVVESTYSAPGATGSVRNRRASTARTAPDRSSIVVCVSISSTRRVPKIR